METPDSTANKICTEISPAENCEALIERSPKNSRGHVRLNRNMTAQVVNCHAFTLLPILEGRWSGDAFDCENPQTRLTSSTTIHFDHKRQGWEVHIVRAASDSLVHEQHFYLEPSGQGRANIVGRVVSPNESPQPMVYEECIGSLFAQCTSVDPQGNLLFLETWTLNIQDRQITRVKQRYENSHLTSVLICKEQQVLK